MFEQPDDDERIGQRPSRVVAAATRYDLVLAVIPLAFAAGTLVGATSAVPTHFGVGGGGVVAVAATAYALFGDPPTGPGSGPGPGAGPGRDADPDAGRREPGAPGVR